jgi:hypothetical protein
MKHFALFVFAASLALAGSGNYRVSLYQPTTVSGMEFKRGDVTLELKDNKALLKQGKNAIEATVTVENSKDKYPSTSVGYKEDNHEIRDIRVGGTTLHVLFQ